MRIKPNVIIAILSFILLFLVARYFIVHTDAIFVISNQLTKKEKEGPKPYRVVIDPGHGGIGITQYYK